MARLRIRLRFNPGRDGAPLDRLGELAVQAEKFLRSFAADLGIDAKKGEWLASAFTNESVAYDVSYADPVAPEMVAAGNDLVDQLTGADPIAACNRGAFSYNTLAEFSRIGKGMSPDDKFFVGVYASDGANDPRWLDVPYRKTAEIRQFLEAPYVVDGAVQGTFHGWVPGALPPFFHVRALDSALLVKCVCTAEQYKLVHDSTGEPNTLLNIYGELEFDKGDNSIIQVNVRDIEQVRPLTSEEFERLSGAIPDATGTLSTDQYVALIRDEGDYGI